MMSNLEHCLEILKALHVVEVIYCLSGGGDTGTVDFDHALYADGKSGPLPEVTLAITGVHPAALRFYTVAYCTPS